MAYAAVAMAGLQLVGGYFASQNIKATARLNQEIAEQNAEYAKLDAEDAIRQGQTAQAKYQSVIDDTLSQQNALMSAQGVDTGFGSAASIQQETRFTAELNLMEIEKRAQEKALGYEKQSDDYLTGGVMQTAQAEAKASNVKFNAITSAAQTGASGYDRYQVKESEMKKVNARYKALVRAGVYGG